MIYNKKHDTYTCANNKELKFIATTRKSKSRYISKIKIYESENCNDALLNKLQKQRNKTKYKYPVFIKKENNHKII